MSCLVTGSEAKLGVVVLVAAVCPHATHMDALA